MHGEYNSHDGHLPFIPEGEQLKMHNYSTVPALRLNASTNDFALKCSFTSFNSMTISHRSTKSSIYSQTSKLQKSSVFSRAAQNKEIETVTKRLQQKESQLQSLKYTKNILEQKLEEMQARFKILDQESKNRTQQRKKMSGKVRKILNRLYTN